MKMPRKRKASVVDTEPTTISPSSRSVRTRRQSRTDTTTLNEPPVTPQSMIEHEKVTTPKRTRRSTTTKSMTTTPQSTEVVVRKRRYTKSKENNREQADLISDDTPTRKQVTTNDLPTMVDILYSKQHKQRVSSKAPRSRNQRKHQQTTETTNDDDNAHQVDYFTRNLPIESIKHTDPFLFRNLAHGIRKLSLYGTAEQRQMAMLAYKSILEALAGDVADDDPEKDTLKRIYTFLAWTFEPHVYKKEEEASNPPMPSLMPDDIKLLQMFLLQINADLHSQSTDVSRRQIHRQINRVYIDPKTRQPVDLNRRKEGNFLPQVMNPLGIHEVIRRRTGQTRTRKPKQAVESGVSSDTSQEQHSNNSNGEENEEE
ncbi:hypothetical protein BDF22DRAFT_696864 [Syncephalis plumigaleata]|nr:hypothetical protein BDF22DRAFT_696864 [Syncephalis plumigaleata]